MDFFKKPVFLIILAIALIVAGIWAYISNLRSKNAVNTAPTTSETTDGGLDISNLTNLDSKTLADSINNQLALADSKAAEVDKKLQLSAIEVDLPASLAKSSGETYFVYSTPNDNVDNWVISISNSANSFVRSWTVKDDYLGNVTVINRDYLKNNYVAAIQIAEKNGGKDYRQKNTLTGMKLILKNGEPKSWLYWFVTYSSNSEAKQFQIDASTVALVSGS